MCGERLKTALTVLPASSKAEMVVKIKEVLEDLSDKVKFRRYSEAMATILRKLVFRTII